MSEALHFFDTHNHPPLPPKEDPQYIQTAQTAGVDFLMLTAGDLSASRYYAALAQANEKCFFTAGAHPHEADDMDNNPLADFEQFEGADKLAGIGEIGLDYFHNFSEHGSQRKLFEYFLKLALKWDLPTVIHCRDKKDHGPAYDDMELMLRDFTKDGGRFVMHCFAGTLDFAERCYEMGGVIGITGIVTFNYGDNIREIVRRAPADRLLLETDAPYLTPVPHRGKPNHPQYIPLIAAKVAEVRGITLEETARLTTRNAFRFFNLPPALNPYSEK